MSNMAPSPSFSDTITSESEVASVNGVALHAPGETLDAQNLRQRACSELLRQAAIAAVQQTGDRGGAYAAEYRIVLPGGEVRWIRKAIATPPEEERRWILQTFDRQILAKKVFIDSF